MDVFKILERVFRKVDAAGGTRLKPVREIDSLVEGDVEGGWGGRGGWGGLGGLQALTVLGVQCSWNVLGGRTGQGVSL